ncbi:undecaprenyldiphospho-muramoylpentapeptide beta-N-acetylglucosaminyltransferase [Pseudactinotalea sp. HY158]|uniref:undecaprenyldiphospho-muramoylpentapeptide beta-N-acetylglucosaminyltransferase n=1 Tax=Pseudactinotalea sp. HY158 TaxID=2654547 RepID=UPI001E44B8D1|nr:undecaprenyldiphospho-muramoylpentapeptide beta-N-acetylglucosaminyltransferase [Pseudactinotalea sp. HY158]
MAERRVVLAGGGSAGHVNPLLATAAGLRAAGIEVTVLGTAEGLEADLVPAAGFDLVPIPKVPLPRRPSPALFTFPSRWRAAVAAARAAIEDSPRAGAVVGFGGYVSTPAYLAARSAGVPVVIHEQNARPGLANRLGARFAHTIALTFPGTPLRSRRHTVTVGLPLRPQISELIEARRRDARAARVAGAAALGLDPDRPIVLVTGGSLGAQRLNETMPAAAPALLGTGAQVYHLTGRGKSAGPTGSAGSTGSDEPDGNGGPGPDYHVAEYLVDMAQALACADLVVCRAGAGTVAELTALGLPAIYVPLPVGNGEQRLNAADVVTAGGGVLVPDSEFTPAWVESVVVPLLEDSAALAEMADRAASAGVQDGAERLTATILAILAGSEDGADGGAGDGSEDGAGDGADGGAGEATPGASS